MKKSFPTSSDKQYSMDESVENSSNEYMNLSNEFQMNMINENKKIKKTPTSNQNQSNEIDIQNESNNDQFWDQEFDPALDSFLKSISKESNMEIDALNEVIQELKKLKNTSNKPNGSNQNQDNNSSHSDEGLDSNTLIDKFNSCFQVSTSSVDEVLDMIEMIQAKRRSSHDSNSKPPYYNSISPIQNNNHINKPQYEQNQYDNQYFSPKEQKYPSISQNQQPAKLKNKSNEMGFISPLEIDDNPNELSQKHKYNFHSNSNNEESSSQRNVSSSQSPILNANNDIYQNQKHTPLQNLYQNYHLSDKSKRDEYSSFNDNSYYNNNIEDSNYASSSKNLVSSTSNSSEIDFLRERLNKLESENRKYKDQLRQQEEKINILIKNNEKLNQSKKRMHQAFDGIENLLKEQVKSTEEIMTQRDSLFSLLQKQNSAFQEIEKRYDDLQQQIIIERLSNGQNKKNEKPTNSSQSTNKNLNAYLLEMQSDSDKLLAELLNVSKQFSDNLPEEIASEIIQIRDNTNIPIQSRINNILNCVCKHFQMALRENESVKKEVMKISDEFSTSESSKSKVINFLENELLFLQKITESTELQSVVFYKPDLGHSLQLDPESRNALLQRCLNAHQFIDKNIGFYSFEQNEKLTQPFNNVIDPSSIFALNQAEEFENKLKSLLSLIDEKCQNINDNDFSLFYDILFSQSIMNEILQKHVSYLQSQLQFSHRQNLISDQQLSELSVIKKNYKDSQNLLATMQQKEKKICEFVLNYFPDLSAISEQNDRKRKSASVSASEIDNSAIQENEQDQEELVDNLYLVIKALIDRYQKQGDEMNEINKNVEIKLKEAKKIFCTRLEKSNKKIKLLKHHLSILKEEILRREAISKQTNPNQINSNTNSNNINDLNAKIFKIRNKEIENFQLIQMKLSELKRLKAVVRKSIINLHDQFRSQIDQFREDAQSALGISFNYKKLAEKNQKTLAQFVKEREALKLKIKQANQGFALTAAKYEAMIRQLKMHISSLGDELNQVKSDNSTLSNTNRAIQSHNNSLRSKIDTLNVANKSLEIKINSAFDNFNNEKRELNIQFEAKMNSLQSDLDSKIKEEQSRNLEIIRCLYKMASKYLNPEVFQAKDKDPDDIVSPETVINSLSAIIDDLKNKQEQYFSVLSDLQKVHKILMLDPNSLVSSKVEQIVSELVDTKRVLSDYQCELSQAKKKILFLSNDNNSIGKMTSQIKQWERWARRVCSIASSAVCTTFSTPQLQNSLEEFILSSLEQRPLMYRIQTLRDEKKYFLKFPKSILTESISYAQLSSKARIPSFRAVIIVYLGVRRIQKAAGLLPLGYDQDSMKKVLDNEEKKH